jgi:alginate biosynthesis protein AlgX
MGTTAKKLIAIFVAFFIFSSSAGAEETCSFQEDISLIFCEAMGQEKLYDENNFDSYKMLIPGKKDWIFRSQSDLRSDFALTDEALDHMEELNNVFRSRGIQLVILLTPTRGLMHYDFIKEEDRRKYGLGNINAAWKSYWRSIESMRNRGIHVVGIERAPADEPFFYKRDHHWNPDGAQKAAQALAQYIQKMPAYDMIEKAEYITRDDGTHDFYGVSKKVFRKLCNSKQPPERIVKRITERTSAANDQSDLFGDVKNPEIVLLGTSNSTMEPSFANFEGFLKEELSADILNMSVSGGGLDTAMISYLNSDFYRDSPAKIAIWEIPSYYDISNQDYFFREATAAAYGSCDKNMIAERKDAVLEDPSFLALDKLSSHKVSGDNYYVKVNFSKPVEKSFHVDLRYVKNRDKYRFQRSGRYPYDKQFYVSLREDKKEYLDKIVLTVPPEIQGSTVSVQLCEKDDELPLPSMEPKKYSFVDDVVKITQEQN